MRTVIVWLEQASMDDVVVWLDGWASRNAQPLLSGMHWWYPTPHDPVLYITLSAVDKREPEDPDEISFVPTVTLFADVSGRHDGTAEARGFALAALRQFSGVATDDYSEHPWTLVEIEQEQRMDGLVFFDFSGSYKRR